ncbi:MAG: TonB-dependent receptor plug domain-containing protein, partial [Chitinophagaceae bacterium]|nr:TonB-dependent receptor plug domain-containing protein [Chitinophagaceae bacterium]
MRHSKPFNRMLGCLMSAQLLVSLDGSAQSNGISFASNSSKRIPRYSQQDPKQETGEKKTLFNVLKDLNKKKGTYFLFSEQSLGNKLVSPIRDANASVEKILDELLKNTGLKYTKVSDNTFVILKEKEKATEENLQQLNNINAENPAGPKKMFFDPISGKITDDKGTPLAGVSVTLKGTNKGTTTNTSGDFVIDAKKGDILLISYVGYAEQAITVGSDSRISIAMSPGATQMTEVVVTALGIKKERKALGYSVTEVKGNELTQARETNVANSLVGKIAGVNVSSVSGGPGSSTSVLIRGISGFGAAQPLYVINGIPMTNALAPGNDLKNSGGQYYQSSDYGDGIGNINPDDIETISVLKGAAASAL